MERSCRPLGAFESLAPFPSPIARPGLLGSLTCSPCPLQNASIGLGAGGAAAVDGGSRVVAALRQAACDLCAPLAPGSLLPPDQTNLVRFYFKVSLVGGV